MTAAKRYREKEERAVLAKLHVEGLKLSSDWVLIEECLSQTVAPTRCISVARRLVQRKDESTGQHASALETQYQGTVMDG